MRGFISCSVHENIARVIKSIKIWMGLVARMQKMLHACKILVEKLERERPFGRRRSKRENNIKMDFKEM
jgi:hypothetical protein